MHIITGLIIAGLAGKLKKNKSLGGLPRFRTGPLQVAHAIPGRIRFIVPSLQGVEAGTLSWKGDLESLPGIGEVKVSPVTGSIVVRYQPDQVSPPLLFGAIARLLGLEEELDRRPTPAVTRELRALGGSLNRAVYEQTGGMLDLWSIAVLSLIAIGAKKMIDSGRASLPAGFTLFWWALNALHKQGGANE